jgi:hypothetical protein
MKKPFQISAAQLIATSLLSQPVHAAGGYVAHEWGTFTSVQGGDGELLPWKPLQTSDLPGFVHDWTKPGLNRSSSGMFIGKGEMTTLQRMETPVIYFYSDEVMNVDVSVAFPKGLITEWYPQATQIGPSLVANTNEAADSTFPDSRAMWKNVLLNPPKKRLKYPVAEVRDGKSGSHYFSARKTAANLLQVMLPGQTNAETEGFIFYRGAGSFKTPLRIKVNTNSVIAAENAGTSHPPSFKDPSAGVVTVENTGAKNLKHLFLISVHDGCDAFELMETLALNKPTHWITLNPSPYDNHILMRVPLKEFQGQISAQMEAALVSEGLFPLEASVMVNTWKDSWFTEEGDRVLYILPRAWTDDHCLNKKAAWNFPGGFLLKSGLRQIRRAHQIAVTFARRAAAFIEGPDDEALAAPAIAGGKDALDVRGVFLKLGFGVRSRVAFDAKRFEQRLFRSEETHRQQNELRGQNFFRAGNILRDELAFVVLRPLDLHSVNGFDLAVGVAFKFRRGREINARIIAEFRGGLFLAVIQLVSLGPFGPGIVLGAFKRGLGQDLHLHERRATVPHRGADAIRAGVAAADDDDILAGRINETTVLVAVEHRLGVSSEEIHREVDALELTAFNRQVARLGGASGEHDGVEFLQQFFRRIIFADFRVADEFDAFRFENFQAAQHDFVLIKLHVGDAIHEQAAGAVGALEHGDIVAGLVQLGGSGKSRRAAADDGDFFAGAFLRRFGRDPAVFPAVINDGHLDVLDRDGGIVHAEHAGTFARGRADATGELREIVRLVQAVKRLAPQAAIDEVVPFGNEIVDRAAAGHAADELAGVAERNPAIHAARALLLEVGLGHVQMKLLPVRDTFGGRPVFRQFALEI